MNNSLLVLCGVKFHFYPHPTTYSLIKNALALDERA